MGAGQCLAEPEDATRKRRQVSRWWLGMGVAGTGELAWKLLGQQRPLAWVWGVGSDPSFSPRWCENVVCVKCLATYVTLRHHHGLPGGQLPSLHVMLPQLPTAQSSQGPRKPSCVDPVRG